MSEVEKQVVLVEVSWEVCNKVGGIYTVITSKAEVLAQYVKTHYFIGPLIQKVPVDFERRKAPEELQKIFTVLKEEGINCHFGKWLMKYDTILLDFSALVAQKNSIKEKLWLDYKIDSIRSGWEFEEPVLWSIAVGRLTEELAKENRIVAHFHEWMAGAAILYLKKKSVDVATVFTTHATILGRSLAGSGYDLYGNLETLHAEQLAYEYGVNDKFQIERACAQNASVFTTVSEITALEAEKTLGVKPHFVTPNGIDSELFPTVEQFSIRHVTSKEKLHDFLTFFFFPYYTFDLTNTKLLFISGRYEFKNKGIDLFIEALGKLNRRLSEEKSKVTVAAFFWIPQQTYGIKTAVLENKNYFNHIKNHVNYHADTILSKIVHDLVSHRDVSKKDLLTKEFLLELRKELLTFKRTGSPTVVTHHLHDESTDQIVKAFHEQGLHNRKEEAVKVVLHPVYLEGNDGLLNLKYYDAIAGCNLGIFPSFYEPWGYTPLETMGMGVPAVTSDLSGFGKFMEQEIGEGNEEGMYLLKRQRGEGTEHLAQFLYEFCQRDKHVRAKNKLRAKELANLADWNVLIKKYVEAYAMALKGESPWK